MPASVSCGVALPGAQNDPDGQTAVPKDEFARALQNVPAVHCCGALLASLS
jgi:hypothetical protein